MKLISLVLACLSFGYGLGCAPRSFYSSDDFKPSPSSVEAIVADGVPTPHSPAHPDVLCRELTCEPDSRGKVIVLGEIHDDARGHAIQAELVRLATESSSHGVLSMEMLERDNAPAALEYSLGKLSRDEFIDRTKSARLGGEGYLAPFLSAID